MNKGVQAVNATHDSSTLEVPSRSVAKTVCVCVATSKAGKHAHDPTCDLMHCKTANTAFPLSHVSQLCYSFPPTDLPLVIVTKLGLPGLHIAHAPIPSEVQPRADKSSASI